MSGLKEYEVVVNGVTTTMLLNEAEAKRLGAKGAGEDEAPAEAPAEVPNRGRATPDKARRSSAS